jgi:hypothetical protein
MKRYLGIYRWNFVLRRLLTFNRQDCRLLFNSEGLFNLMMNEMPAGTATIVVLQCATAEPYHFQLEMFTGRYGTTWLFPLHA